jgi:hypothetical protein
VNLIPPWKKIRCNRLAEAEMKAAEQIMETSEFGSLPQKVQDDYRMALATADENQIADYEIALAKLVESV